ncbi:hypothetical protein [Paenibacillus cellulositrophicus]|uniref:hypothetical protein n=1 Tax=Paenibacillus cellulositrophicus TaxID=562959 RepID=UPI0012674A71|nr:hypothetical protein [Paenibacillus cellulositrophicus]
MWSEVSKLIGANPIVTLVITIIGTSSIWMYKEFKEMINRNNSARISRVNEKIKIYSQLQASIAVVLNEPNNSTLKQGLINKLGEYSPFLNEDLRCIVKDYYKCGDSLYLNSMLAMMEVDFSKFEQEKRRVSKYEDNTEVEDIVLRLYDPLKPILLIWLLIIFFLFSYENFTEQQDWFNRMNVIASACSWFLSIVSLSAIFSLKLNNRLSKQGIHRWILIGVLILAPIITVFYIGLSLCPVFIQITSLFLIIRLKNRKKKGILTFD